MTIQYRDTTFDIMKGIGILLVITCHFFGWNHPVLARVILSFHMPMFFIVAGYFSKSYVDWDGAKVEVRKYFNRLFWPLFFTQVLIVGWTALWSFSKSTDYDETIRQALCMAWVDVDGPVTPWGKLGFGVTWFLMALFNAKVMLLLVVSRLKNWAIPVSLLLAVCAIALHKVFPYSIWCISLGLTALPFVTIGWWFRNHSLPKWLVVVAVVCWVLAIIFSELDMYSFTWNCYPLDVVGACGGTLCLYFVSKCLNTYLKTIPKLFAYLGVVSLAIMCMHHFEMTSNMGNHVLALIGVTIPRWLSYIWRYVFTVLLAVALIKTPFLKKIFT